MFLSSSLSLVFAEAPCTSTRFYSTHNRISSFPTPRSASTCVAVGSVFPFDYQMVGMKNADRLYWDKKVHEALEKIDWDVMNKHLHTRANRGRYEAAKKRVCQQIHWRINGLVEESKEPTLAYYDKLTYAARKISTPDNSIAEKLRLIHAKGSMLKKTRLLKGVTVATGLAVGLAGLANAANKKEDSVKTD